MLAWQFQNESSIHKYILEFYLVGIVIKDGLWIIDTMK